MSNVSLKKRNAKIFKSIENKLRSDDEKAYIDAAEKLRNFVSRKEAYYPEARPLIVHICKTARETLTRLMQSNAPFHCCNRIVPTELQARAATYARLIKTVLHFVFTFENDHLLKDDLKELFFSVTVISAQLDPPDIEMKQQKEESRLLGMTSHVETRNGSDLSQGGSRASSIFVPSPGTSPQKYKGPSTQNTSPVSSSAIGTTEAENRPASSAVAESPTTVPSGTTPKDTPVRSTSMTKVLPNKPAAKAKKLRLKKAVPVDMSLIEADLNWQTSKQRQLSEPRGSVSSVTVTDEVPGISPVGSVVPEAGINTVTANETPIRRSTEIPISVRLSDASRPQDSESAMLFHVDKDGGVSVNPDSASSPEQSKFDIRNDAHRPAEGDANMVEATTEAKTKQNRIPITVGAVIEKQRKGRTEIENRDGFSRDPLLLGSASIGAKTNLGPELHTLRGLFDSSAISFACIDLGRNVGDTLSLQFDLSPEQRDSLSLWQLREQYERDLSTSTCVSLASYKTSDVLEASFDLQHANRESFVPVLLGLTPSWPTNARLSADIGSFRMFLAPPLQVTHENLVDISAHINSARVEISLDHVGDMQEYIFAVLVHPPTPSQLQELEERRAELKKFRVALDSLSITRIDVFG